MDEIIVTTEAAMAVACWLFVALGAAVAIYSIRIRDTLLERIALACVSIASVGTACRIISAGWISEGAWYLSVSMAFYVVVVFVKHIPRGGKR